MLALFPQLLSLSWFAAFMIRITLTLVVGYAGYTHAGKSTGFNALAIFEVALAGLLLIGAWTQVAGMVAALLIATWLIKREIAPYPVSTVLLTLVMALSLIMTGSGPFAFDLPL